MLDGIAENFTAATLNPYLDGNGAATANAGIDFIDPQGLREIVTVLDRLGFQCHFHAIGDRAVRNALDAVEAARAANGGTGPIHHVAHLQVVQPGDASRLARLGVAANAQPLWACNEPQMVDLTLPFLGPAQALNQYPFASLLREGAILAMGSDWPVSTPNVMQQIEVAVTRRHPAHRDRMPFLPREAITLPEALKAFTLGSALVNRVEHGVGTIEVGKTADLVLFDRDPFRDRPIGEARVRATWIEGRLVYRVPQS
jgi:predicted amidohydrolase YtcJ